MGPGDDAALVRAPDGRVVATTDLLVDGVHFDRSWSTARDVGRKAAAQNLADVAAMGAVPSALLVGLAAPAELTVAWAEELARGLAEEAGAAGAAVAGGDLVASDRLTIAVTALGDLAGRAPVLRSGARPGDAVVVAGRLGWAAAGLDLLRAGLAGGEFAALAEAHRHPEVAYRSAVALAEAGATAMIDCSDGLAGDLGHLAASSRVRIDVRTADLPIAEPLRAAAERLGVAPLGWVAGGGDDHAFLATLPRSRLAAAPPGLVEVGEVLPPGREGPRVTWDGGPPPARLESHEHFRLSR